VSLTGLSKDRFNGKCGVVVGYSRDGKVRVQLDGSTKEYSLKAVHVVIDSGGSAPARISDKTGTLAPSLPVVGSRVSLSGLSKTPRFNGKCGVVVWHSPEGKVVRVVLDEGKKEYSLKARHVVLERCDAELSATSRSTSTGTEVSAADPARCPHHGGSRVIAN
jgi:ribosomal protein L21E